MIDQNFDSSELYLIFAHAWTVFEQNGPCHRVAAYQIPFPDPSQDA
jgi:hypothetical protein